MLQLIINGAAGRMGQELCQVIQSAPAKYQIAYCADHNSNSENLFAPAGKLQDFHGNAHCVIDFSSPRATQELTDFALTANLPLVVATTGQNKTELALLHAAAKQIPVFLAANMSLGIAALIKLVKQVTTLLPDADIEIIEQHHKHKLDVPSGTALEIAKAIQLVRPAAHLKIGRQEHGKRDPNEIGIHSLRLGNVVGIHEIIFTNGTETITLRHEAHRRAVFAQGALHAADFLVQQKPGLYQMTDLLKGI